MLLGVFCWGFGWLIYSPAVFAYANRHLTLYVVGANGDSYLRMHWAGVRKPQTLGILLLFSRFSVNYYYYYYHYYFLLYFNYACGWNNVWYICINWKLAWLVDIGVAFFLQLRTVDTSYSQSNFQASILFVFLLFMNLYFVRIAFDTQSSLQTSGSLIMSEGLWRNHNIWKQKN